MDPRAGRRRSAARGASAQNPNLFLIFSALLPRHGLRSWEREAHSSLETRLKGHAAKRGACFMLSFVGPDEPKHGARKPSLGSPRSSKIPKIPVTTPEHGDGLRCS